MGESLLKKPFFAGEGFSGHCEEEKRDMRPSMGTTWKVSLRG